MANTFKFIEVHASKPAKQCANSLKTVQTSSFGCLVIIRLFSLAELYLWVLHNAVAVVGFHISTEALLRLCPWC